MKTTVLSCLGIVILASVVTNSVQAQDQASSSTDAPLPVFQNLDEATSRIPNLANKPIKALIDAHNGFFQNETIIFKDVETGNEVWSLTRELCTELANIERRTAWSCNGQYISFIGNTAFWDFENNSIRQRPWAGHSYVANADSSDHRKVWGNDNGNLISLQDKFNNWDASRPNVLYYPGSSNGQGVLWRVTLGKTINDNKAEIIYHFPNAQAKIIQEISDDNFMLIEEQGGKPNCYVINLNVPPTDTYFCLTYPLKGEVHPGSFRFMRSQPVVRGHYEQGGQNASILLTFADLKSLKPIEHDAEDDIHITQGRRMDHLWYGAPDDRVGFFGAYNGKHGLYLQLVGEVPVLMADVPDGHVTWCSHDPDWFFGAIGPGSDITQTQYARRLVACSTDRHTVKIICTPFDRRRPERGGYDAIPRPNQSPDATKCWFHSSMLMPTNKYTGSFIAVFRKPYPPSNLSLKPDPRAITLQWTPDPLSYELKTFHVYRSEDGGQSYAEITTSRLADPTFTDTTARKGKTYIYAVTAEEYSRLESDITSNTLVISTRADQPRVLASNPGVQKWDTTPPPAVTQFNATKSNGLIRLQWTPSSAADLRYYNIYASSQGQPEIQQQRLLVSPTHDDKQYIDWSATPGQPQYYAITAIDRQGNESEPVYTRIR